MTPPKGRQRFRYEVTFESESSPVEANTARGEIEVPNASLGVRRAFEAAKRQLPNRQWTSIVVMLERL